MQNEYNSNVCLLRDNIMAQCTLKAVTLSEVAVATETPLFLLEQLQKGILEKKFYVNYYFSICEYFGVSPEELLKE